MQPPDLRSVWTSLPGKKDKHSSLLGFFVSNEERIYNFDHLGMYYKTFYATNYGDKQECLAPSFTSTLVKYFGQG